jgi:ribonuclease-3
LKILSFALTSLSIEDKVFKQKLKNILGFSPTNLALYKQAFRHSSFSSEISEHQQSNERLEFLGDAILGAVVAEYLFQLFPKKDEGFLTQIRSRIVNGQHLFTLSKKFGLDALLQSKLTKKEKLSSSAYGDVFEALIGAVFLDKGFKKTKNFIVNTIIKTHLDLNTLLENDTDYKSKFQILMQRQKKQFEYIVLSHDFSGKEKTYNIQLIADGQELSVFEHKSKKVAEQKAAQLALELLERKGI